ncbi:hypothetical protein CLH_0309 [Clostridium botulinum E3 str. Alaska E43]|nr:hypothetical protein CLH_0309 [Clostridium botulinum E3 str. Alaska E43]
MSFMDTVKVDQYCKNIYVKNIYVKYEIYKFLSQFYAQFL